MNKFLIFVAVLIAVVAAAPAEDVELKQLNESYNAALKAIEDARKYLKTEYIEDFAGIIKNGCTKLHDDTVAKMAKTTDAAQRHADVDFAIKAYARLQTFLDEVQRSIE